MQQLADVLAKPGFRKAATNFGWLSVERAGRFVLAAAVGLLVVRYLGPARWGSLSYCTALVTLIGFAPALGLDAIVKRELLRSPAQTAEVLASSLLLRLGAGALAYAIVLIVASAGWGFAGDEARVFAILGAILFQPAFFLPELWLQAQLRAKWIVAAQLGALAVVSGARIWLILHRGSLVAFAWVIVVEMTLGAAGFFWSARRMGLRFPAVAARVATMRRLLAEAWPLMFASLAIFVYMKIDEVMLRQLAGPAVVGIYAAAAKLSEIWYFVPTALASSVLPALMRARAANPAEYARRQQQYYDVSAAVAYALSVPIALAAPLIVRLAYGAPFAAAGPVLTVHIWSSIFVFLGVARGQWLVNEGLQKFYLASTVVGAVVNVGLNFVLIPSYGGLGAASATVVSYALAAWIASYFHPAVRTTAGMQTRALLIPFRVWSYFRRP
jgi:polysaccharide transporter, PST family